MSKRLRLRLMDKLQEDKPAVFTSPVLYDGQAIMFSKQKLPTQEHDICIDPPRPNGKPPKVYKLKITAVDARVNLDSLHEFVAGRLTHDAAVQMSEMALNIAIRMLPRKKYPSNARSFFIEDGKKALGAGLEVRRGYFQSLRPAIGRLLLNLDISAAVFYKPGPLIGTCLEFLGVPGGRVELLSPARGLRDSDLKRLAKFVHGMVITTRHTGKSRTHRVTGIAQPPSSVKFKHDKFGNIDVVQYFKKQYNITLQYPGIVCVKAGKDSIPIELCEIQPGQFSHNDLTPDQTKVMVEFSTMSPHNRFQTIFQGLQMLEYGQSEYVRQCGITVEPLFVEVDARILPEPNLKVAPNPNPRKAEITPENGKWNMLNSKYYKGARISGFLVMIFENERRFGEQVSKDMIKGFVNAAKDFGVTIDDPVPKVKWVTNRSNIEKTLVEAGKAYMDEKGKSPQLILAVLPPNSKDLYNDIKRFGYITMGIATQCLLSTKCSRANHQYWANIMLKVNVKMDGTNFVPNLSIIDVAKPTIIMGADAIHPAPGTVGKPSFTALVSSVDTNLSKYVASNGIQEGKKEMIEDMHGMCTNALEKWQQHQRLVENKRKPPLRLIYFRDGVSEGEFPQVLAKELPKIKAACKDKNCDPKITIIIAVKRHHHRGMPVDPRDGDSKSGNIPAGATIDTGIMHPVEHDYLQYTHGGLLGTSRPARYTVLYDENVPNLSPDAIQALTYGLAHSFARATRSVSIPAPVYYAHLVCAKRAVHFDPAKNVGGSDTASQVSGAGAPGLQAYKDAWSGIHSAQSGVMYWMVSGFNTVGRGLS
ncbi:eukaryotic translation initiation factor 2C 2 [Ephemerocybe angulata]|uniref:Eukaryotic translation initiation factor 2C 2 n=1 Tax=Ephemerocybe angulata TaxID=980116 RepID=A0A8H6HLL8_9AGAR|nr:eukaryotic translation initiation factor 2C 2 [Tulosesus angulatus]